MHDLDTYNDRLIAFEAVKASDASRLLAPRQALQNKSNQTLSPPPKQSSALDIDGKVSVRPSPGSGSEFTNKTVTGIENHAVGYENRQSQLHAPGGPPVPSHQSASHVPLAKTRSPSTSHRSSPAVQAVPRPSGTNYRSGSSGTDSLLSGISYNPLAAQRPMPLTHSSSPSATPDQQFPTSAGFHRFYETISDRVRASFPSYTEGKYPCCCYI